MCGSVCRHFKLILHRSTDVFSTDFRAVVMSDANMQQSIEVEAEFYRGYEDCKFSVLITLLLFYGTFFFALSLKLSNMNQPEYTPFHLSGLEQIS